MWRQALIIGMLHSFAAFAADTRVAICYNYGCSSRAGIVFDRELLAHVDQSLLAASSAEREREVLARVIGQLYGASAMQSPVGADRAGNFLDQGVDGRMDCIDHSSTTTGFLEMLAARGSMRYHRTLQPARRSGLFVQHFSAAIEELAPPPRFPPEVVVPDHVPILLALCDCAEVTADLPAPPPAPASHPGSRYVIDSWFVNNGEAAVVLPLDRWMDGDGPNVQ